MRIVATALGLCVAVTASCSSAKERPSEAENPEMEMSEAQAQEPAPGQPSQQEGAQESSDYAEQQAKFLTLAEQKKRFLVENHIQRAGELRERNELEQAEQELAKALQLDPANSTAK